MRLLVPLPPFSTLLLPAHSALTDICSGEDIVKQPKNQIKKLITEAQFFLCGCSKFNLISLEVNDMFTWLQVVLCMQRSVCVMRESTRRDNTVRYLFWITKATNKCMSVRIVNTLSLDSVYGMVMTKSHGRGLQYLISLKGRARQPLEFYMNGEMFSFLPLLVHRGGFFSLLTEIWETLILYKFTAI